MIPTPPLTTYVWRFDGGKLLVGSTKEEIGLLPTKNDLFELVESSVSCRTIRAESVERATQIINQQT